MASLAEEEDVKVTAAPQSSTTTKLNIIVSSNQRDETAMCTATPPVDDGPKLLNIIKGSGGGRGEQLLKVWVSTQRDRSDTQDERQRIV